MLLSASTFVNPTTPKVLSFDASAFVTINHQIRVSVNKATGIPVAVILRDKDNQILFQQNIGKKEAAYAVKMNVDDLTDGQYDLEIKSSEGSIHKQVTLLTEPTKATKRVVEMQ
ncbi:hypothetical protein GCM10028805_27920 [Spirosoma harenae]